MNRRNLPNVVRFFVIIIVVIKVYGPVYWTKYVSGGLQKWEWITYYYSNGVHCGGSSEKQTFSKVFFTVKVLEVQILMLKVYFRN